MPSGVLWVAYQALKAEMEYCVRVETRLYLSKYKNSLKIVWSDMRKTSSCLLVHAVRMLLGKR